MKMALEGKLNTQKSYPEMRKRSYGVVGSLVAKHLELFKMLSSF
jgi:hypothetical protein